MQVLQGAKLGFKAAAAVVLVFAVGLLSATQTSAQDETIAIGRVTLAVAPGAEATLDLEALDIGAPGLAAWTIDVVYDPAVVTPVACASHASGLCNPAVAADRVRSVGAAAAGLEGDTALASITFQCESEGTSALAIIIIELADATTGDLQPIAPMVEHGAIYCVSSTGAPPGALGDVNCDGRVNSVDAQLVLQLEAGLISSLPCPENADVNGDGEIDSRDAQLILQFEAGLITVLG